MKVRSDLDSFFASNFEKATRATGGSTTNGQFHELKNAHLFITGGTGFFGCWLLHLIQWLNQKKDLRIQATLLTRNEKVFLEKHPEFVKDSSLHWLRGNVRDFEFPQSHFTHIIHAATDASVKLNLEEPLLMLDTIVEGTRRVLEFARISGASRVLLTSSGAVYGKQPSELTHVPETYLGAPDPLHPSSAYGEGKRLAEFLCTAYRQIYGLNIITARCYAFMGPYLPWETHFAAGNFLRDAVQTQKIKILGDGTPFRSYLYGADLAVWLFTLLIQGQPGKAYNVGSDQDYPLSEMARVVARVAERDGFGKVDVEVAKIPDPNKLGERYIPSVSLAKNELDLRENFTLEDAIHETLLWYSLSHSQGDGKV